MFIGFIKISGNQHIDKSLYKDSLYTTNPDTIPNDTIRYLYTKINGTFDKKIW